MWLILLKQAKDVTRTFIDPADSAYTQVTQQISQKELLKLEKMWNSKDRTICLKELEALFFPRPSKNKVQQPSRHTWSQVTEDNYTHGRTILTDMSDENYTKILIIWPDTRLIEIPFQANFTNSHSRLAPQPTVFYIISCSGSTLRPTLRAVENSAAKDLPGQWTDQLEAGPFATREAPNSAVLMHAEKSHDEAARLVVQALFDKMRDIGEIE